MLRVFYALFSPSTILAACCVLGAALTLWAPRWRCLRRAGQALLVAAMVGNAAVLALPVDIWVLRPLEDRFPPAPLPGRIDGVVVLGGAISDVLSDSRGITLNRDADRLVAFAILARAHPEARLVFAGGSSADPGQITEAEASHLLLDRLGLSPDRVLFEDQSQTTWENAVNAHVLAHPAPGENWVLVTSASHMPRAMAAFRRAGWPPMLPWPVAWRTPGVDGALPWQPLATRLMSVDVAAHEWAGLARYRLRGDAGTPPPKP